MASRGNGLQNLLGELQQAFAEALLRGDEPGAEDVLRDAIDAEVDEATIDDWVIAPSMRLIGDLWADNRISVAEEHMATEIALRVVTLEREAFRVARQRSGAVVLLGAVEGEEHVVGLRMVGSLLLHAGYDVRQLGPNLPATSLGIAVARHGPAVIGLTATMPGRVELVHEAISVVGDVRPGTGVIVGGAGVPEAFHEQPGVRVGRRVGDAVAIVDGLAQRAAFN